MRIAVTGAAGFIASHLCDAFLDRGHEVLAIDDLSSGRRENVNPRARFVLADIRSPQAAQALRDFRPEVLDHHAAQMDVRRSVADPRFDAEVNLLGLLNLLEAGRSAGLRRVLFASSGGAAYGEQERFPAPETHRTAPLSPYGVSKVASELYLECYRQLHGLSWLALRYANVYGPRQNAHGEGGVVAIFSERCLRGEGCTINGDGAQTRDFVFVEDVVRANLLGLESAFHGPVNIGTGRELDINTVYALIAKQAGLARPPTHAEGKTGEQRRSVVDATRASHVLQWRPQVSFEEGIAKTVAWFRANLKA